MLGQHRGPPRILQSLYAPAGIDDVYARDGAEIKPDGFERVNAGTKKAGPSRTMSQL